MFGKVMSLPDGIVMLFWRSRTTRASRREETPGDRGARTWRTQNRSNPMHVKKRLAAPARGACTTATRPPTAHRATSRPSSAGARVPEDLEEFHRRGSRAVQRDQAAPDRRISVAGGLAPARAPRVAGRAGRRQRRWQRVTESRHRLTRAARSCCGGRRMQRYQPRGHGRTIRVVPEARVIAVLPEAVIGVEPGRSIQRSST